MQIIRILIIIIITTYFSKINAVEKIYILKNNNLKKFKNTKNLIFIIFLKEKDVHKNHQYINISKRPTHHLVDNMI